MASVFDYVEVEGATLKLYDEDGNPIEIDCGSRRVSDKIATAIHETLPTWGVTFDPIGRDHPDYAAQ